MYECIFSLKVHTVIATLYIRDMFPLLVLIWVCICSKNFLSKGPYQDSYPIQTPCVCYLSAPHTSTGSEQDHYLQKDVWCWTSIQNTVLSFINDNIHTYGTTYIYCLPLFCNHKPHLRCIACSVPSFCVGLSSTTSTFTVPSSGTKICVNSNVWSTSTVHMVQHLYWYYYNSTLLVNHVYQGSQ